VVANVTKEFGAGGLDFLPALATGWNVSADGQTYTFNLRRGVTFHNGDPFNSYMVWGQFYIQYYFGGNSSSFWVPLNIFNTSAINVGPATLARINQSGLASPSPGLLNMMSDSSWPIYVTGPYTVVFHLKAPFLFFLNTFAGSSAQMFDPMYILRHGGPGTPGSPNPYFHTNIPPGTGPYMVTRVQTQSLLVLQKNPTYWGNNLSAREAASNPVVRPGYYQNIIIKDVPDESSRYIDLSSNSAQLSNIVGSDFKLVLKNPTYSPLTVNSPACMVKMGMNNKVFPTNITLVRQAIVHAINYSEVINQAVSGEGFLMVGPETPNYGAFYDPGNLPPYAYNLTLASQDLAKAGFPNGTGLPSMAVAIDGSGATWNIPAAEIVQTDLAQIGIKLTIQVVSSNYAISTYLYWNYTYMSEHPTLVPTLAFDYFTGFCPDYLGPTDYWTVFASGASPYGNFALYDSPAVDNAVSLMAHTNNLTAIVNALKVAQKQVYDDAPYAWLFAEKLLFVDGTWVWNKNIIKSMYMVPDVTGVNDLPLLNTITPA
jgi:peptide/nickel transport system substrate-binding protein